MRVYVVRHGESVNNLNKLWTGWNDVELSEKGREDAKRAGEIIKGVSFDRIYSSDLSRAMDTARIAVPGCEFETSELFREMNVGTLSGKHLDVITSEEKIAADRDGYGLYGGESTEDFSKRVRTAMAMLESAGFNDVAVFSHAGFLRKFLDEVVGTYIPRQSVCCNNCTVAIFECENHKWKLHSWINVM